MIQINFNPTPKQAIAWIYLNDKNSTEIFFGGSAGCSKTFLGCAWLIINCLRYPGSRWLMGRAVLKALKDSTLLTFFDICKKWGLQSGQHYEYNSMSSVIKFYNGSEIYLKDLFQYPSDPNFDDLGSTEYSSAFIDEASQISSKAKNIVLSRLRYKINEFGITPKLLICSNPTKNFLYTDFYKPFKNKTIQPYRKCILGLPQDNPHLPLEYIENLKKLDTLTKERLLYGNWEYDDDSSKLMMYDKICDIFTNKFIKKDGETKYITCDPARFGQDRTVIYLWQGWYILKVFVLEKKSTKEVREFLEKLSQDESVARSNIVSDEDGVGGGIIDEMKGIKGFVNNASPVKQGKDKSNYANQKSQCYYLLAEKINKGEIGANFENIRYQELLIEDLEQIKRHNADKDNKMQVTPKEIIKQNIGRSPDFSDCMMMRMYFNLNKFNMSFLEDKDNQMGLF
jgi:hypothetical protein